MSSIALVVVILIAVWNTASQKAGVKPLWEDELNELNITCQWRFTDIAIKGAYTQCSAPPLYYLLSKAYFNLFRVDSDQSYRQVLINARSFSRISVVLLVLVLLILYRKYLKMNWIWLPIVLSAFFNYLGAEEGHIFWAAAEVRPYGFWTLLIGSNLLLLHIIEGKWGSKDKKAVLCFFFYGLTSFALITTVTPGIVQVGVPAVLTFSLWRYRNLQALFEPPRIFALLLILAGLMAVLYYNLLEQCRIPGFYGNTWGTVFQFFTGFRTPVMFMVLTFGWIHVFRNFNTVLSRMVLAQFLILFLMVAIVHVHGYHFVPRVLIMGHFLSFYLAVAGCKELKHHLESLFHDTKRIALPFLWVLLVAVSVYHSANIREMIKHGMLLRPMNPSVKMIDQRKDIVFPLCSPKRR